MTTHIKHIFPHLFLFSDNFQLLKLPTNLMNTGFLLFYVQNIWFTSIQLLQSLKILFSKKSSTTIIYKLFDQQFFFTVFSVSRLDRYVLEIFHSLTSRSVNFFRYFSSSTLSSSNFNIFLNLFVCVWGGGLGWGGL